MARFYNRLMVAKKRPALCQDCTCRASQSNNITYTIHSIGGAIGLAVVYSGQDALKIVCSFVIAWVAITIGIHCQACAGFLHWGQARGYVDVVQSLTKEHDAYM